MTRQIGLKEASKSNKIKTGTIMFLEQGKEMQKKKKQKKTNQNTPTKIPSINMFIQCYYCFSIRMLHKIVSLKIKQDA